MKYACQYAIVRFMPFVETGEFANVGIVMMCQEAAYFDFILLNRVRRITAFFDQLAPQIYRDAKTDLKNELQRVKEMLQASMQANDKTARFLFQELIRTREVMLRFDEPRVVLTNDPATKLEELFRFYVERNFVTHDYVEKKLEKRVRNLLADNNLPSYRSGTARGGAFSANFPFAHYDANGEIDKAIKPLYLAHDDPAQAHEHGWAWLGKFNQLQKSDALPRDILVVAEAPSPESGENYAIFQQLEEDFQKISVPVIPIEQQLQIKQFAHIH
ncbi:DUF3037 domain-containing protein [Undibacterium sp. Di27W]|uniref:DUF3037 domain-containing protein n=1 Tax=Undibacterium sp. Di27W TaxID=3413036 RepID=UPI003BF054E7